MQVDPPAAARLEFWRGFQGKPRVSRGMAEGAPRLSSPGHSPFGLFEEARVGDPQKESPPRRSLALTEVQSGIDGANTRMVAGARLGTMNVSNVPGDHQWRAGFLVIAHELPSSGQTRSRERTHSCG